jgi:8-amino-3,8-dideoxy-alpha-D-manno-octulosonate transaminase
MSQNQHRQTDLVITSEPIDRRKFLTAAAGIAATGVLAKTATGKISTPNVGPQPGDAWGAAGLAVNGGSPVRATKLQSNFPGPLYYDDEERRELLEVLDRRAPFRWYGIGPKGGTPDKCTMFEKEFAAHRGAKYCVAVTSGTAALITAMAALGAGPGDEVILPAWTWYSCYDAIISAGATPVFAEIDDSMDIDPADIERHITPRTKIIMPVHIMGEPADMDPILAIARKHNLKVLEDCAQSSGATYKGRPVGSMGDCGIYSFQLCKTISAGEGGALVTNDPLVFERAARFHDIGDLRPGHATMLGGPPQLSASVGWQFRMSEWTGAVMRAQLRKLDHIVADFRDKGTRVAQGIADLPNIQFRKTNDSQGGLRSSVYFATSSKAQRDHFIEALHAENIPADHIEGSVILPIQPFIEKKEVPEPGWPTFATAEDRSISYGANCCPRTIDIWNRYVGVPMDPKYSHQDVTDIIAAIRKVYPAVMHT